jgi:hypothetical protein
VVATFDYPTSTAQRLFTAFLKPTFDPLVRVDGVTYDFVVGTASDVHLLHVPSTIGKRRVPNAGLDLRRISFPNAPGPVRVRFFALPARSP